MKILLFKIGAIGDVLMTTPLVRQLRKKFQNAQIDYLTGTIASQVLTRNKNINQIITFDEAIFFKKELLNWFKLIRKIRARKYDFVFVLDKHKIFNFTAFLLGIKERIGFDRLGKEGIFLTKKVFYGPVKHEIFYYLDLLKMFGGKVDYADFKIDCFLSKKDEKFASMVWKKYQLKGKQVVGIAPGGGKNSGEKTEIRNWPIEKYSKLIKKLTEKQFILLVGDKGDIEKEKEILKTPNKKIISFIGKCSLKESAALIKKCNHFICNDSGAMHLASAVNQKIISVFGPTNPKRKAPLWKQSIALWKDQDIYEENYELFGKKSENRFMTKIRVEDVLNCIE